MFKSFRKFIRQDGYQIKEGENKPRYRTERPKPPPPAPPVNGGYQPEKGEKTPPTPPPPPRQGRVERPTFAYKWKADLLNGTMEEIKRVYGVDNVLYYDDDGKPIPLHLSYTEIRDTWEEAHAALMDFYMHVLDLAIEDLNAARTEYNDIKNMTKPGE